VIFGVARVAMFLGKMGFYEFLWIICWLVTGTWMEFWMTFHSYWKWNNHPNWRTPLFFRGVETTNQYGFIWDDTEW
jgi:hypothetical protein